MTGTVSVIIPTKDRPNLLGYAVASALQGLSENGQIVVVDDHSKSPATQTLAALTCPKLKIVSNTSASGCSAARNFGASVAHGDLLFFLDDDDLMHPDYVAHICEFHMAHPDYDFGFSATRKIQFETTNVSTIQIERNGFGGNAVSTLPARKRLFALSSGVWIKQDVYNALGGLDESISINEDTDFAIRLLAGNYKGWYVDTPATFIRHHPVTKGRDLQSITWRAGADTRAQAFKTIYDKNRSYLDQESEIAHFVLSRFAKFSGRSGQWKTAWPLLKQKGKHKYLLVWLGHFTSRLVHNLFHKQ